MRFGPEQSAGPALMLPGVGEHTASVLSELGFDDEEIKALATADVVRLAG